MKKAKLTGKQLGSAVIAGIVGHLLFAAGWLALGVGLVGGLIATVIGSSVSGISGQFGDVPQLAQVIAALSGAVGVVVIAIVVGSIVLIAVGFLVSGLILRGGGVRDPWATTGVALLVAALVSIPLLFIYGLIANGTDLSLGVVSLLGSIIGGVAIWVWMTWLRRGPLSIFAGSRGASARSTAITIDEPAPAPPVEPQP